MFNRMKLSEWMEEQELTNCELAKQLGVSEAAIRHIRLGIKQPSLGMAVELAQLMECKLDDVVVTE